jgi:RNA polymerase sigma-70 factor (ECF subfamily)
MAIYLDDEVRRRLQRRDKTLLNEIFSELNPYLLRCLSSRGIFGAGAEDIICETWITFLSKLESFEGRSTIKTYLTGILLNKIQESFRQNNKFVQLEENLDSIMDENFTPDGWWKQKPHDPFSQVTNQEVGSLIEKCLEGLSPQQKGAFILKEVEEEESESVCSSLGISLSHLGVLIFRAKEKLRKCLEGQLKPGY